MNIQFVEADAIFQTVNLSAGAKIEVCEANVKIGTKSFISLFDYPSNRIFSLFDIQTERRKVILKALNYERLAHCALI